MTSNQEQQNQPAEKRKVGRPKGSGEYHPSTKERERVAMLSGSGMSQLDICRCVIWRPGPKSKPKPITINTLRKHFAVELATGKAESNAKVLGNLMKLTETSFQACRYWLANRAGWTNDALPEVIDSSDPDADVDVYEAAKRVYFMLQRASRAPRTIQGEVVSRATNKPTARPSPEDETEGLG